MKPIEELLLSTDTEELVIEIDARYHLAHTLRYRFAHKLKIGYEINLLEETCNAIYNEINLLISRVHYLYPPPHHNED